MAARRILVVDDDPLVISTFKAFLSDDGHFIESAATGEEAMAKLGTAPYDLVIADYTLPLMNGVELAGKIRSSNPEQPFILTSGSPTVLLPSMPLVPNLGLLSKPFEAHELKQAVTRMLGARFHL